MSTTGDNRLPTLASEIRQAHASAREHQRKTLEQAIRAGELLIEAKTLAGHGKWQTWLKEKCGMSDRTARLYMQLAKNKEAFENGNVADLGIRGAVAAIADPFRDLAWCERFEQEADAWRASRPQIPDYPSDWTPQDRAAMGSYLAAYNDMWERLGMPERTIGKPG